MDQMIYSQYDHPLTLISDQRFYIINLQKLLQLSC